MDSVGIVRSALEAGESQDEIAHALMWDHHLAPIPAIKAMRSGGNMTLGEAKEVVHRNLPAEQQETAEQIWDELMDQAERIVDEGG